uniref:RanBP2-type domain-containing protein n=1 Tax=Periophthalmus magnuspinnatus TaxID=409849 RepID=A0A3B3ZXD1_9GOBI
MGDKRSPTRPKRQPKSSDEGLWDCSVCTYKNTAEAFKCMMCDVRKGTSTSGVVVCRLRHTSPLCQELSVLAKQKHPWLKHICTCLVIQVLPSFHYLKSTILCQVLVNLFAFFFLLF